eukprot:scaffold51_cov401-Prasinococcus_capsulatus_cf.AAC.27
MPCRSLRLALALASGGEPRTSKKAHAVVWLAGPPRCDRHRPDMSPPYPASASTGRLLCIHWPSQGT